MKMDNSKYPYVRLKYSWDMILCLNDFINCIGIHKKDLKSPRNIGLMNFEKLRGNKNFNPAGVLKDYIYLEANSFFDYAKDLKSKGDKNLPELPPYLKELKKFRNFMVGHRDKKEKIDFPNGWLEFQEKINKLIPLNILIKDVDEYHRTVMNNLRNNKSIFLIK